jgi:hypothetical protein
MAKKPKIRSYQPYCLYRRSDLWIKDEFDGPELKEQSINKDFVITEVTRFPEYTNLGNTVFTECENTELTDSNTTYWSMYANKPCALNVTFDYDKCDYFNDSPPRFFEFKFDAGVFGPGWLRTYVTNKENIVDLDQVDSEGYPVFGLQHNPDHMVQKFWGPCSWQISDYHKLLPDQWIQFAYTNAGKQDPLPRCEIDNITVYPYYKIDCEVAHLVPGRPDTQFKKLQVLRGYNAFQTQTRVSTMFDVMFRFYNTMSFNDFIRNIQQPHVLCDEQGILYRGIIELDTADYYGSGIYEQKAKFYSHCKLGVGWI